MKKFLALVLTFVMLTFCTCAFADGLLDGLGGLVDSVLGGGSGEFDDADFKTKVDKIEAFYDEYCTFLTKYSKNPEDASLLADYASMVARAAEADAAIDSIDEDELSEEDLSYFNKAMLRIEEKLAKVGESLS